MRMLTLTVTGLLLAAGGGPVGGAGLGRNPTARPPGTSRSPTCGWERAATGPTGCGGTVRNSGARVLDGVYPRVWARFHGPDGSLLFQDYDYLARALPIGQRRDFEILLLAPHVAAGWEYYRLGSPSGKGGRCAARLQRAPRGP